MRLNGSKDRVQMFSRGNIDHKKYYQGDGFLSSLGNTLKKGFKLSKQYLKPIAKSLGPTAIALSGTLVADQLAKRGAPDALVNAIGGISQDIAQSLDKNNKGNGLRNIGSGLRPLGSGLNRLGDGASNKPKSVSGFVNKSSERLLQQLLSKQGSGVMRFGQGSLIEREAPRINN